MKSRVLFLITLLVSTVHVSGQNLVPNGSFEEGDPCPGTLGAIEMDCSNWFQSIALPGVEWFNNPSPDWFHVCSTQELLSPPSTIPGYQETYDGEGYAGFATYVLGQTNYREILGVELTEPLQIGTTYLVQFRISRGYSQIAHMSSNNVGIKFSSIGIYNSNQVLINNFSHFSIDTLINDTINWIPVEFEFLSDSAYTYLHVGNFYEDDETIAIGNEFPSDIAYYFIDDVKLSVVLKSSNSPDRNNLKVYPNPAFEKLNIEYLGSGSIQEVSLFNSLGVLVFYQFLDDAFQYSLDTVAFDSGLYILKIKTNKNEIIQEKIIVN